MLPRDDCEAIRRAVERDCHSIVRFDAQFNVVVVVMWDQDWAMALRSSSLMFRQLYSEPASVIHTSIAEGLYAQNRRGKNTT